MVMHDDNRIPPDGNTPQLAAMIARLERRLAQIEKLLDEGVGAFLNAKFPYGDHKTDRWGRR
jgi:hypothetical protein